MKIEFFYNDVSFTTQPFLWSGPMKTFALFLFIVLSVPSFAGEINILELSLTADSKAEARLVDGYEVIESYAEKGIFKDKPSAVQDYSDFYVPQKPVYLLGARLIVFEYEYQQKYIGCCVNPGNAVVLLPNKYTDQIWAFAEKNKCRISVGDQIFFLPKSVKKLSTQDRQNLIELSCKDNYLFDETQR